MKANSMKKLAMSMAMVAVSITAAAQGPNIYFGLGTGFHSNQMKYSDLNETRFPTSENLNSGVLSLFAEIDFLPNHMLAVRPQFSYLRRGGTLKDIEKYDVRRDYISVAQEYQVTYHKAYQRAGYDPVSGKSGREDRVRKLCQHGSKAVHHSKYRYKVSALGVSELEVKEVQRKEEQKLLPHAEQDISYAHSDELVVPCKDSGHAL